MKQFATLLILFFALNLNAQVQYGTIDYVRQTEFTMAASSDVVDDKVMKKIQQQMASAGAFTNNYRATFSPVGFTFAEVPKESVSIESDLGGGNMIIMETGGGELSSFYTDTKAETMINRNFIFDKGFLVEGSAKPLEWTITDESVPPSEATVGLDLKIATAVTPEGDTVTAGFAPSLPVQVGPRNYYGLPGAIITLRIPGKTGGAMLYRAISLELSPDPLPLVKPTEGKKISVEKFRAEKAKRQKTVKRQFIEFRND